VAILTQQFPVITVWRDELVRQGPIGLLLQVSKHCSVMFLFSFRSSTSLPQNTTIRLQSPATTRQCPATNANEIGAFTSQQGFAAGKFNHSGTQRPL